MALLAVVRRREEGYLTSRSVTGQLRQQLMQILSTARMELLQKPTINQNMHGKTLLDQSLTRTINTMGVHKSGLRTLLTHPCHNLA